MSGTPRDKYEMPEYVDKRVRYFHGEFLKDEDFVADQMFHMARQQRHARLLHVSGVIDGLDVSKKDDKTLVISAGSAVDDQGRQILLKQEGSIPIASSPAGTLVVEISFHEEETDLDTSQGGVQGHKRFTQQPALAAVASKTEGSVKLGEVTLAEGGVISGEPARTGREYSGLRLPGPATGGNKPGTLRSRGDGHAGWAELGCSLSISGDTNITGGLTVNGELFLDGASLLLRNSSSEIRNQGPLVLRSDSDGSGDPTLVEFRKGRKGEQGDTLLMQLSSDGKLTATGPLDIQHGSRTNPDNHPATIYGLYVTANLGPSNNGVEFRHYNGTSGLGFGYNTIYAAGTNTDHPIGLKPKGNGAIELHGDVTIDSGKKLGIGAAATNPLSVTGNANITGNLSIGGDASISGTLTANEFRRADGGSIVGNLAPSFVSEWTPFGSAESHTINVGFPPILVSVIMSEELYGGSIPERFTHLTVHPSAEHPYYNMNNNYQIVISNAQNSGSWVRRYKVFAWRTIDRLV